MMAVRRANTRRKPHFLECVEFAEPLPSDTLRILIVERIVGVDGWKVRNNQDWRWQVASVRTIEVKRLNLKRWFIGADDVPLCWILKEDGEILRKLVVSIEKLTPLNYSRLADSWYMRFTGKDCTISAIELVKLI